MLCLKRPVEVVEFHCQIRVGTKHRLLDFIWYICGNHR